MRYCLIKKVVSKMFGKLKNLFGGDTGITIAAPTAGTVVALESVPDPTFAQGILGPGIAIEPSEGRIVAPADGTVDVMFETGHAVSMTTADGAELLIHVGIDTVQLEGKHYKACCKAGQQVKKGDVLIEFDPAAIKAEGYQIVTPILVCNPDAFTVEPAAGGTVAAGDALLTLKKKYTIKDALGIHARPAGLLVKEAGKFASKIMIASPKKEVDAKRIMGVMSLGVKCGDTVKITIEGEDEETAAAAMQAFLESNL